MADDATFFDAFATPSVLMFVGVEVQLPNNQWIRWLDGSGVVTFGAKTFTGSDLSFGVLAEPWDDHADGFGDQCAQPEHLGINPATADGAAILGGQQIWGKAGRCWSGSARSTPRPDYPPEPRC